MEFYHYDIFETKGLEYIVTIVFFALLVPLWFILKNRETLKKGIRKTLSVLNPQRLSIPKGIFHSPNHTWAFLEKSGNAIIGLDEFLLSVTGPVTIKPLVEKGMEIKQGDIIAKVVHDERQLKVHSPISGTIQLTNHEHTEDASALMSDPYGDGWMFEISPSNWIAETRQYYLADDVINWSVKELSRIKDFLAKMRLKDSVFPSGLTLQDGGELQEHFLAELGNEFWEEFQNEFLDMPVKGEIE
jgi:glycine cleavage system H protein